MFDESQTEQESPIYSHQSSTPEMKEKRLLVIMIGVPLTILVLVLFSYSILNSRNQGPQTPTTPVEKSPENPIPTPTETNVPDSTIPEMDSKEELPPPQKFLTSSFDRSRPSVDPNFKGHDPEELFQALNQKIKTKGTYETTPEYQTRLQAAHNEYLFGKVNLTSTFVFRGLDLHTDYDADTQMVKVDPADLWKHEEDSFFYNMSIIATRGDDSFSQKYSLFSDPRKMENI